MMRDARCLLGFHRWVGVRAPTDTVSEVGRVDAMGNTWTGGGLARPGLDPDHVVWCKRCGKDRSDASWWMAGLGG
jgi:hypothetical protein